MKVDNKTIKVDQELTTEIDFNDNTINKLYIKSGSRKDFTFKNIKVSFLTGLHLRYSPLTQEKIFIIFSNFEQDLVQIKTLILPILNRT